MGPCIVSIFQYISNKMQRYTVYFIWKLLYIFRVVLPPIVRSAYNCIYSIWYLSHRYCYLPLSWKSWNWFECTVVCTPDVGWKYHPKHVEQFPDINKLCDVASCWIYIGILLGAHYIPHISRIRVNMDARLVKHCCCGRPISITYSSCVFVAVVIHYAKRMSCIFICGLFDSTIFFTYHNGKIFGKSYGT